MGEVSLQRRFLRLAGPNILANLLVPLASLVDIALLGHLDELHYLGGVALAAVLFDYVFWTFGFLRMATTGLTAQARGRGDRAGEHAIVARGTLVALAMGTLVLLAQVPLRELGFAALQGSSELEAAGRAYFDARIWGAPFALLNFMFLGWLLGREESGRALVMVCVGQGANILLDVWFIGYLGWAAAGAGAATALSQVAMLLVALALTRRGRAGASWSRVRAALFDREGLRSFFALSGDITVRTLLLVSTFAVFLNLAAGLGEVALAVTAVLRSVVMLAAYFTDGFAFATESLAGVFQGSGDSRRLRRTLGLALAWGTATSLSVAIVFVAFPRTLLSLLTDHVELLDELTRYVWWLVPVLFFGGPAYVLDGYFLGLTRGGVLRRAMLVSVAVGFAPWAWWAHRVESVDLLWLSLALFMVARTVTLGRAVRRG